MLAAEPTSTAANAINALGIDLFRRVCRPQSNALLSPYSIQSALVMAYAGAEGDTRAEMAKTLHFPHDDAEAHRLFALLPNPLDKVGQLSAKEAEALKQWRETNDRITLCVANQLFGQIGYEFRDAFLNLVRNNYDAPFEALDFARNASGATRHINLWVEEKTRRRICNLIPDGALGNLTRLVLVNALYLKAPWTMEFSESATQLRQFYLEGSRPIAVPTMTGRHNVSYVKRDGFSVAAIPFGEGEIQFLILLPDELNGLAELEMELSAGLLAECAHPGGHEVLLYLPKLKIEPPLVSLGKELQALGMSSAFDQPRGSANLDRMAPRRSEDYLYLSEVYHKALLILDEKGAEATAATMLEMRVGHGASEKPIEVRVDHPFIFAIQYRASGACLFLGRVTDPRGARA